MNSHRFDLMSFVFGALFVLTGTLTVTGRLAAALSRPGWVWPVVLAVLGAAILRSALPRGDDGTDAL